jgi:hypothetical protein
MARFTFKSAFTGMILAGVVAAPTLSTLHAAHASTGVVSNASLGVAVTIPPG